MLPKLAPRCQRINSFCMLPFLEELVDLYETHFVSQQVKG